MLFEIFFKIEFSLKTNNLDFEILNFPFLDGDVPRSPSYGVHILQLSYGVYISQRILSYLNKVIDIIKLEKHFLNSTLDTLVRQNLGEY